MIKMRSKQSAAAQSAAELAIIDGTHLILLTETSNDECIVPAVPLKDVPNLIGRRYVSCFDDVETSIEEYVGELCEIEEMQLDMSDLDDDDLIRPIKLSRDGQSSSLRIWSTQNAGSVTISWSNDNALDVQLPVFTYSSQIANLDLCDDKRIYGDGTALLHDYASSSKVGATKQSIEIQNASSCLVADFLGVSGYQQIMVLPLLYDGLADLEVEKPSDGDLFRRRGNLLKQIINRSFLTDGYGVLHSEKLNNFDFEVRDDNSVLMTLPSFNCHDSTHDLTDCETASQGLHPSSLVDENEPMDIDANNTNVEVEKSTEDPAWLKTLQKTIEHRISKKQNESAQIDKSNQMCQDLIARGREALHRAVRCGFNSDKNLCSEDLQDPQVVRLRYGMQPRSSMDASGISVVMDLEVDVYFPEIQCDDEQSKSDAIREFHISCLISNNNQTSSRNTAEMKVTCDRVRTVSGLVQTLKRGECVTIMASVYFTNLNVSSADSNTSSQVDLSIQGYWVDGVSQSERDTQNRQGTILCLLQLSEDTFYMSASKGSSSDGRCVHDEIDFLKDASDPGKYIPTAIFEHREPRTLAVDISGASNLQDSTMWRDLAKSLNTRVGMNSHIDLFWKKGEPQLKLVVFGSNQEERTATTKLLLQRLPESAKLISNMHEDCNQEN